jgi:hypothetical protein
LLIDFLDQEECPLILIDDVIAIIELIITVSEQIEIRVFKYQTYQRSYGLNQKAVESIKRTT